MGRPSRYGWRPVDPPRRPVLFVNPRPAAARRRVRRSPSGRANEGSASIVLDAGPEPGVAGRRGRGRAARMRSAWPVATGRSRSSRRLPGRTAFRSSAFPPARATTSRSTSGSTGTTRSARSMRSPTASSAASTSAEVNGRLFLNNVSLGIYGEAVHQSAYRDAKVRTLLETAREVLGPSAAAPELHVVDDLGREHRDPAVVLVSNNPYALDRPVAPGTRPTLDSGRLGVVVLDPPGTRAVPDERGGRRRSRWTRQRPFTPVSTARRSSSPPARVRDPPCALRVRISARHPGVSPSGVLP